jgi:hypothetical protein
MTGWISRLDRLVTEAAKQAELPESAVAGADGGGWVWLWRDYLEDAEPRVAESRVVARPDAFGDAVALEVSGAAWMETRREVSWSQAFYSHRLLLTSLHGTEEPIRDGNLKSVTSDLGRALADAWREAHRNTERLDQISERRGHTLDSLRAGFTVPAPDR